MSTNSFILSVLINIFLGYSIQAQSDIGDQYSKAFLEGYWSVSDKNGTSLPDASILMEDPKSNVLAYERYRELSTTHPFFKKHACLVFNRGRLVLNGKESNFLLLLGPEANQIMLLSILDYLPNSDQLFYIETKKDSTGCDDSIILKSYQDEEVYTLNRLSGHIPQVRFVMDQLEGIHRRYLSPKETEKPIAPNWDISFFEGDQANEATIQLQKKYSELNNAPLLKVGSIKEGNQDYTFAISIEQKAAILLLSQPESNELQRLNITRRLGAYPFLDQMQFTEKKTNKVLFLDKNPFKHHISPQHPVVQRLQGEWILDPALTNDLGTKISEEDTTKTSITFEADKGALDLIPKHTYDYLCNKKIYLAGYVTFNKNLDAITFPFILTEVDNSPMVFHIEERAGSLYLEPMDIFIAQGTEMSKDLLFIGNGERAAKGPSMPPMALTRKQ